MRLLFFLLLPLAGCGLFLDADSQLSRDGGMDARFDAFFPDVSSPDGMLPPDASMDTGVPDECLGSPDWTVCNLGIGSDRWVCLTEVCRRSTCGDGFADAMLFEECDDGNAVPGDGCEIDCTYSCESNGDCDDDYHCNGGETCDSTTRACLPGTPQADGSACRISDADGGCIGGFCVPDSCGNGMVDGSEQCDDGNMVRDDGCEPDCTFTCEVVADCAPRGTLCFASVCDVVTHACVDQPRDSDGDGYLIARGCGGTDCDDMDPLVHPDQPDLCNGIDDDCDVAVDEDQPPLYCWPDADNDGHASATAAPRPFCGITACAAGLSSVPGADCHDANSDVFPGQPSYFDRPYMMGAASSYDYDCDGSETPEFPTVAMCPITPDMDCLFSRGFVAPIPTCGGTGDFVMCQPGLGGMGCMLSTPTTRIQGCH